MNDTIFIGIDPGASGGIAVLWPDGSVSTQSMPDTLREMWESIHSYQDIPGCQVKAYLERVGGFIGNEAGATGKQINRASGHTMFRFGQFYGQIQMALTAAQIPFEEVPPQRWVKIMGISPRKKSETKTEWKRRCKEFAQKLHPTVTITNSTADAVLIAEACKRSHAR